MSRGRAKFTQSDAERLFKAAAKAGINVRVEFRSDRSIVVTTDKSADLANEPRPSDSPEEIRKLHMKPPRSALPLPRYVLRKRLKDAWGYFFNVPTWARKAGCPVKNEPLGPDYDVAVRRAEMVLLPAFDSWLSGGASAATVFEDVISDQSHA